MSDALALLDEDEREFIGPLLSASRPGKGGEWRGFCPRHEDPKTSGSPSASFNFNRDLWHCMGCNEGGKITTLIAELRSDRDPDSANVVDIKSRQRKARATPLPTRSNLEGWHNVLMGDDKLRKMLMDRRGFTRETLKRWLIGWSAADSRYTIPVFSPDGELLAVKLYWPNAKAPSPKMYFWGEDNDTTLFNARVLSEADNVVYTEGELDCILLCQKGIPAVTSTGGAKGFQPDWARSFEGKNVWITPDDDATGSEGAVRTAEMLEGIAASVHIVQLDTGIKGGDVTDYFIKNEGTVEEFRRLLDRAEEFTAVPPPREPPTEGRPVSLVKSQDPALNGEPVEVTVMVSGKITPPIMAPKKLEATCDRKKGEVCKFCVMYRFGGEREVEIPSDDPTLLAYNGANVNMRQALMVEATGAKCSTNIKFVVKESTGLEELIVTQSVGHRTEGAEQPLSRKVLNVGTFETGVNSTVRIVGTQRPDPRDSRGILHGWKLTQVAVDIDTFVLSEEDLDELSIFQRESHQTPLEKCLEIAEDMAANVTGIRGRPYLHVGYDLVWHSLLGFEMLGKPVPKGWLEALVIGDTRTGKSDTALYLSQHYNSGIVKSCEGATFAGLVGGATQTPQGRGWMITWGTIPLHDRRLVVLDEFSGIKDKDIIEQMSSIRSSGVASLQKIISEEASARTRLIWISNDPDGKRMPETDGMDALRRLVHQPEDIARFDFAMALSNAEVPSSLINSKVVTHPENATYTSELCAKLVLWAWSRRSDAVRWHKGSDDAIIAAAEAMGSKYVSTPPLVQVENIRMKLARIAVALAARTFSTDRTGERVVVRPEHVRSAVDFLDALYGSEVFGYLRHSRRVLAGREQAAQNHDAVLAYLRENAGALVALRTVSGDKFRLRDFEDFGAFDPDSGVVDARSLVHSLLKWKMIRRLERGYIAMEPELIAILKEMEDEGL